MPTTSASRPVTLRKMMRRVRLEKLMRTNRCQLLCNSSASRPPRSGGGGPLSNRSGSTSVLKLSGVRLSTVRPGVSNQESAISRTDPRAPQTLSDYWLLTSDSRDSHLLESIADAVERFDHVELVVGTLELLAQPLDVAVDGAVVNVDLIVIGRVHQRVAALDHAGPARQRLQDQELGDRERDRLVLPGAGVALRIHAQEAALKHLGRVGLLRRGAVLGR